MPCAILATFFINYTYFQMTKAPAIVSQVPAPGKCLVLFFTSDFGELKNRCFFSIFSFTKDVVLNVLKKTYILRVLWCRKSSLKFTTEKQPNRTNDFKRTIPASLKPLWSQDKDKSWPFGGNLFPVGWRKRRYPKMFWNLLFHPKRFQLSTNSKSIIN